MDEWTRIYRGALLQCEPQALANGQYSPRLVVQIQKGTRTTEIVVNLKDAPLFEKKEDAFENALARGKKMVDEHS